MSWLFSQALVAEYLGGNFSDGEQSVPSSGKPIPQAYCAPDKMTAFSRLSRFGMTYKPLTATRGEELLMSYRAALRLASAAMRPSVWASYALRYFSNCTSWSFNACACSAARCLGSGKFKNLRTAAVSSSHLATLRIPQPVSPTSSTETSRTS